MRCHRTVSTIVVITMAALSTAWIQACVDSTLEQSMERDPLSAHVNDTMVTVKEANGVTFELMPMQSKDAFHESDSASDYLAFKMSMHRIDMSIDSGRPITLFSGTSPEEQSESIRRLTFDLRDMLSARTRDTQVNAALAVPSNTYELGGRQEAIIVFPILRSTIHPDREVAVIFDDRIFRTGVHRFSYTGRFLTMGRDTAAEKVHQ